MNTVLKMDNNESLIRGVFKENDHLYIAITYSQSRSFKTEKGAIRWFKKVTGK